MRPKRLNIIFNTITETEYIKLLDEIQSLKELTTQQALELQEYKNFFENFKKLVDK